jgi:hypothetical protein
MAAAYKRTVLVSEVLGYITTGRRQVQGDMHLDPYAKYRTVHQLGKAMVRDAHEIASWFNSNFKKWTEDQAIRAYMMIVRIQRGPAHYWKELLRSELSAVDFRAAESWADREHQVPGCVDVDANLRLRDAITAVLWHKAHLNKTPEPYNGMKDILAIAFYGPTAPGEKWDRVTKHNDYIDL